MRFGEDEVNHIKNNKVKPYVGVCRGALGELFQGLSIDEKQDIVVVSSLIPKYSWAYFTPNEEGQGCCKSQLLTINDRYKSFQALEIYCERNELPWPDGNWHFYSDLKVARGMASSTADIVAILRCAASYFNRTLELNEIVAVLSKIERSDSVFLDRPALFSSSRHEVISQFNKMPPLYALYMHEQDTVETDGTKSKLVDYYQQNQGQYRQLYNEVAGALGSSDLQGICQASSKSAELSQEILPKPNFHQIYEARKRFNADGIITAHTGSVLGLLFCNQPDIKLLEQVGQFYKELDGYCQYTEIGS